MEQTIGEKIATLRKARNITQTELAEYLFLVPQTVSRWEAGNGTPDISLLPRIADFFNVSLDDLFGRSSLEYAKDLVLKYSILRDDRCFLEALECLEAQLKTVDCALKLGMREPAALEHEKIELEAYKMHLLLQQSRESAQRALAIAEDAACRTGDMRFRLQRIQLQIQLGNRSSILSECETQFRTAPAIDTLRLYFEALSLSERNEELLKLASSEPSMQRLMMPPSPENAPIWLQCALAAAATEDVGRTESYELPICQCGSKETEFSFLRSLTGLYSKKGLREKCDALKPRLTALLSEVEENPYYAARARQTIEAL